MATQTKSNQNEPKGNIMVVTSPYHTASIKAYPEVEESRSAPLTPERVTSAQVQEERFPSRKEALPVKIARGFLAFNEWLSGPGMADRDREYLDIAKVRSEWYGRLEQQKLP